MSVQQDLATMFSKAVIRQHRQKEVAAIVDRIDQYKFRYNEVVEQLPGIPWWAIAVIHNMECSLSFNKHLHNGDLLSAKTKNVPAGRPLTGTPPFDWAVSAVDALKYDKFDKITDWSIGSALDALERYNGVGYRKKGVPSPYLWSFTDQYISGKYVKDGVYDSKAVSGQAGVAALIKDMQNRGIIKF
jgi:lysozyme family protein